MWKPIFKKDLEDVDIMFTWNCLLCPFDLLQIQCDTVLSVTKILQLCLFTVYLSYCGQIANLCDVENKLSLLYRSVRVLYLLCGLFCEQVTYSSALYQPKSTAYLPAHTVYYDRFIHKNFLVDGRIKGNRLYNVICTMLYIFCRFKSI